MEVNEELQRQTERQQRELALLAERLRGLEVMRHELNEARAQITILTAERDGLRAENEALLSSTSWRMTGPLRAVVRLLARR